MCAYGILVAAIFISFCISFAVLFTGDFLLLSIGRYLISQGAHVGAVNSEGDTPLDIAEEEAMEELLQNEVNRQGNFSYSRWLYLWTLNVFLKTWAKFWLLKSIYFLKRVGQYRMYSV